MEKNVSEPKIELKTEKAKDKEVADKKHDEEKIRALFKCPKCRNLEIIEVEKTVCVPFHVCKNCQKTIKAPLEECCIVCPYTDKKCPCCEEVAEKIQDELKVVTRFASTYRKKQVIKKFGKAWNQKNLNKLKAEVFKGEKVVNALRETQRVLNNAIDQGHVQAKFFEDFIYQSNLLKKSIEKQLDYFIKYNIKEQIENRKELIDLIDNEITILGEEFKMVLSFA